MNIPAPQCIRLFNIFMNTYQVPRVAMVLLEAPPGEHTQAVEVQVIHGKPNAPVGPSITPGAVPAIAGPSAALASPDSNASCATPGQVPVPDA